MKKFIFFSFLIIFPLIFYYVFFLNNSTETGGTKTLLPTIDILASPTPLPKNSVVFKSGGLDYVIFHSKISDKSLKIIPNFKEKKSSKTIIEENNCQTAINAGFYTEDSKPLGLFINSGEKLGSEVNDNSLLTGFFYINNNKPDIEFNYPSQSEIIIQSGPLLINNNPLKTKVDEQARRTVIAKDVSQNLYALSVVLKEEIFSGPTLSNLPQILFNAPLPFKIDMALNMDGGSASVYFVKNEANLSEFTTVGSIICAK